MQARDSRDMHIPLRANVRLTPSISSHTEDKSGVHIVHAGPYPRHAKPSFSFSSLPRRTRAKTATLRAPIYGPSLVPAPPFPPVLQLRTLSSATPIPPTGVNSPIFHPPALTPPPPALPPPFPLDPLTRLIRSPFSSILD